MMLSDPANEEELRAASPERTSSSSDGETGSTDTVLGWKTVDVRDIKDGSGRYKPNAAGIRITIVGYLAGGWRLVDQKHIPGLSAAIAGYTCLTFSERWYLRTVPLKKQEDVPDIKVYGRFEPNEGKICRLKASYKRKGWTLGKQQYIPGTTSALPGHTILTFSKFI